MPSPQTLSAASQLILNVDDSDAVRYARSRALTQAGYRIIEASSGEEALLMISTLRPQLVVLDVNLPGVDGLEVCRRIKTDRDSAHVMVLQVSAVRSSKMDMVAGLEGGADGYLIEPIDPLELAATVRALLRLADRQEENRRLIRRLTHAERQFVDATEAAECGLWDWDIKTGRLEWFGAHERLAGMHPGSFSGKIEVFSQILHAEDRARVWDKLRDTMARGERRFTDEYRFIHPDGSVHWMGAVGRFFYDDVGEPVRMTGVVQEITARKEAEERVALQHERLRLLARASEQLLTAVDPDVMMRDVFDTVQRHLQLDGFFNYRLDEASGQLMLEACAGVPEGVVDSFARLHVGQALCGAAAAMVQPVVAERLHESRDEKAEAIRALGFRAYVCHPLTVGDRLLGTLSFASKGRDRFEPDEIAFMQTVCRYVAAAKERLRLEAEARERVEQLSIREAETRESSALLSTLLATAPIGFVFFDRQMRYRVINEWLAAINGLSAQAHIGKTVREAVPDLEETARAVFNTVMETGQPVLDHEFVGTTPKCPGVIRSWNESWYPIVGSDGAFLGVGAIVQETTEYKRQRDLLQDSEERLRILVNGVRDYAIFMLDVEGRVSSWNEGAARLLGYHTEEVLGMPQLRFYPEEAVAADQPARDLQAAAAAAAAAAASGRYEKDEWRVRQDGSRFLANTIVTALRNEDDSLRGYAVVMRDITERRAHEAALTEQARLLDLSNDAIIVRDKDDRIRYWNHGAQELYGWTDDEAVGKITYELLQTEFAEPLERIVEHFHRDNRWSGEVTQRTRDGRRITVSTRWSLDRDTEGRPASVLVTNTDITERRRAEEAVRERERFLSTVTSAARVGLVMVEEGYVYRFVNDAYAAIFDLPMQRLVGRHVYELLPDAWTHIQPRLDRAFAGEHVSYELTLPPRAGESHERFYAVSYEPHVAQDGRRTVIVVVVEITERRRAEGEVRESEERLRAILDRAPAAIFIKDRGGRSLFMNEECARVLDVDRDGATGKTEYELFPEALAEQFRAHDLAVWESGNAQTLEEHVPQADGVHTFLAQKFLLRDAEGAPYALCGIATDITPRRRMEDALRENEQRLQVLTTAMPQLVWACSSEGACIFQSPQWETVTGQPAHESLGYGWAEMIHPDDRSRTAAEWRHAVERGAASYRTEYRLCSREGGYRWYLARAEALHDEAGGVLQWIGTSTDITDRMQAEEELRRYKDELEVRVGERTQALQASQERLRELASQLTMTEQRERQKIARDLHDYLAQMLVVGRMKMGSVKKQPGLAPATVSVLGDVETIFQQALTYTRTLIGELSPPSLRDYGLPAALRWLSERMQKDGLWVEVLADREQVPLSEEHAVVLFQCVRELLFNVLKHAGTDRATVQVTVEEQGGVRLSVHDRGRGFSPDALRRATEPGHLGLFAIRERMESIGGRMAIHTAPGHGTTVTLSLEKR